MKGGICYISQGGIFVPRNLCLDKTNKNPLFSSFFFLNFEPISESDFQKVD